MTLALAHQTLPSKTLARVRAVFRRTSPVCQADSDARGCRPSSAGVGSAGTSALSLLRAGTGPAWPHRGRLRPAGCPAGLGFPAPSAPAGWRGRSGDACSMLSRRRRAASRLEAGADAALAAGSPACKGLGLGISESDTSAAARRGRCPGGGRPCVQAVRNFRFFRLGTS